MDGNLDQPTLRPEHSGLQRALSKIAMFVVVALCTVTFTLPVVGVTAAMFRKYPIATRDLVAYWASGHLLVHGQNPYDRKAILEFQHSAGYAADYPLVMRNPPIAAILVYPLGFLSPRIALLLWVPVLFTCLVVSVRMVSIMQIHPGSDVDILGYCFGPALFCMVNGQMSILALFGLAAFLRFCKTRQMLAGLCLWFCMLKPHLFLPFGVAVVAWTIYTRMYKILLGAAIALGISTAFAQMLDHAIWTHYRAMLISDNVDASLNPCLSIMLRLSIDPKAAWLQYLPAALGCAWALAYFHRNRNAWSWTEHGSVLALVSFLVAPYTWITDQAILIPALLHGAHVTRSRLPLVVLAMASFGIEIMIILGVHPFHSRLFLWTAPAWLAWYLWAVQKRSTTGAVETLVVA